ncbi:tRNA-specific adenosine deaminase [Deltaproteobacteria bacterium]|nr:tRNA-specific adenosine deaminase [Deltaproteobacteria bacterium]
MEAALEEAGIAESAGEVPVGAVLLSPNGEILGRGHNAVIADSDPTAHAEIRAIRQAGNALRNYRMGGALLAVTLEPCLMCVGAMLHARLGGLVFGAFDPKTGAVSSRLDGFALGGLSSMGQGPWVAGGVLATECGEILRNFFARRR